MIKVRRRLYGKQKTHKFEREKDAYQFIKKNTDLRAVFSVFINGKMVNATAFYYRVERENAPDIAR